jgi:hypothetical protein
MERQFNIENFDQNGFCEGPIVLTNEEVSDLRRRLEEIFKINNYPKQLSLFDIKDKYLIKKILSIYSSPHIKEFISELNKVYNENVCIIPRFIIHRNYHVDRFYSPGIGWHRDCGGELKYKYCNKSLSKKSYVFGKLGIYLQENSSYGGSIDIIPKSHKYIKINKKLIRKIKNIKLFLLIKLQKYFLNFYKLLPEDFYMKILKAKRLKPKIGSFIMFDSRIIHRGSPIDDKVRSSVSFNSEEYRANVPLNKTKFSLYVDVGNAIGLDSYMYDRNQRMTEVKEIEIIKNELEELSIYNKFFADEIKNIFSNIIKKYS